MTDNLVLGLVETITIFKKNNKKEYVEARIDTGATKNSIDFKFVIDHGLGPILRNTIVKSAHGSRHRPIVALDIEIAGKKIFKTEFTLADRSNMKYKALIGRNVLKKGFMVDPNKNKVQGNF